MDLHKLKDDICKAQSQSQLAYVVEAALTAGGENRPGETYLESANRMWENKPDLAARLELAEIRWFELDGRIPTASKEPEVVCPNCGDIVGPGEPKCASCGDAVM